jgi:hypothetical protein
MGREAELPRAYRELGEQKENEHQRTMVPRSTTATARCGSGIALARIPDIRPADQRQRHR